MKTPRFTASVLVLALCLCVTRGRADDESHRQAAQELLSTMRMDTMVAKSIEMQMAATGGPPGIIEATREFYAKFLSWDTVKPELVAAYMDRFSEEEIRELDAFYRTPAGQKLIEAQPALTAAAAKVVMACTREHMDEYQRMIAEAMGRKPPSKPKRSVSVEVPVERLEAGSLEATFVISLADADVPQGAQLGDIKTGIVGTALQRLKALGITRINLVSVSANSFSLKISTVSAFSVDDLARLLGQSGELAFRIVSPDNANWVAEACTMTPNGFRVPPGYERCEMPVSRGAETVDEILFVQSQAENLSERDVDQAVVTQDQFGNWPVSLTFTAMGAQAFLKITADNVGRRLAMVVDGKVLSAPVIREAISGGRAQITGSFGMKEAKLMAATIDSGRYPIPVTVTVRQ